MPVQFPNFLAAQLAKSDYSGLGDIFENYYAGKAMPRNDIINKYQAMAAPEDYLIKQIQAEFARPKAQAELATNKLSQQSTSLSNQNMALQIQQLKKELAMQAEIDRQIKKAQMLGGQGGGNVGGGGFGGQAPQNMLANGNQPNLFMPQNMSFANQPMNDLTKMQNVSPALKELLANPVIKGQEANPMPSFVNDHPAEAQKADNTRFQELEQGNPVFYGIDKLYELNPLARSALEKRGFKFEQKRESDKKSGIEKIYTQWPSGRVTIKTILPQLSQGEKAPVKLTNAILTQNQRVITSVDNALPELEKLKELPRFDRWSLFHGDEANDYQGFVEGIKDNLLGAFGLTSTEKGLETAKNMVLIGKNESKAGYLKRIDKLIERLKEKQAYSKKLLENAIPIESNETYSSNDWEVTNAK
jgi:hypothetical protein